MQIIVALHCLVNNEKKKYTCSAQRQLEVFIADAEREFF